MRILILASLATLAGVSLAVADTQPNSCQIGNARHQTCIVSDSQPAAPQAATPVRPPVTRITPPNTREDPVRRRNGKRVPDAELIGPRGAL